MEENRIEVNPTLADLQSRLPSLMPRDARRLRRRLDGVRKVRDEAAREAIYAQIVAELDGADQRVTQRRAAVPAITYPPELPVSQAKDEILAAIRDNQVVIVAGETGSGKTTQLPRSVSNWAGACSAPSGTPSRAAWPPGRWPSGSPRNSAANWARWSATRSGSPTSRVRRRWSS
jgi:hypothetical protein